MNHSSASVARVCFDVLFIIELYQACSGNFQSLVRSDEVTDAELEAFLRYCATFLSNVRNYYVSTVAEAVSCRKLTAANYSVISQLTVIIV